LILPVFLYSDEKIEDSWSVYEGTLNA